MNHASLFTGIGGFDLAAEWMGWTNIFSCEKDKNANLVLENNFPNVKHYKDIFELDAKDYEGKIDILTGGFPCQPFSLAGKRKGRNDERYLWPEMFRIIKECKPTVVIGENVFGIVNMEDGATLERIYADLEGEGYKVESFIIPACAVQAWHRRDRIWIIAYTDKSDDFRTSRQNESSCGKERLQEWDKVEQLAKSGEFRVSSNADSDKCRETFGGKFSETKKNAGINGSKNRTARNIGGVHRKSTIQQTNADSNNKRQERCAKIGDSEKMLPGNGAQSNDEQVIISDSGVNTKQRETKPGLGWWIDGFSDWMDKFKSIINSENEKENTFKILQLLWSEIGEKEIQRETGGFQCILTKKILLSFMWQFEKRKNKISISQGSEQDVRDFLRSLWDNSKASSTPHRSKLQEQYKGQYTDLMHFLSRKTPSFIQEGWKTGGWEDDIARTTTINNGRGNRLKQLGNAIVPQVAYELFKIIDKAIFNPCTTQK